MCALKTEKETKGVGEMAQQLRTTTVFLKELGSIQAPT